MANIARGVHLRDLEREGAKIHYYEPGMVHGKVSVIDDRVAMIGSTNLDQRSLFLNYEVSAFAWDKEIANKTNTWIDDLVKDSTEGLPTPGRGRETLEGLIQVIAPLL